MDRIDDEALWLWSRDFADVLVRSETVGCLEAARAFSDAILGKGHGLRAVVARDDRRPQNAAIHIVAGAHHAFDRADVPPTTIADAVTSTTFPTVYMDDAGTYLNLQTGKPDPSLRPKDFTDYAVSGGFVHKGAAFDKSATFKVENEGFRTDQG